MTSDQRSSRSDVCGGGKPFERASSSTAALLAAFAALGCYQSYAELMDGDHDAHESLDDARSDVRDDGALPDFGPDADADGETDVDADSCVGGWYDSTSGLCWQDPPEETGGNWDDAVAYCNGLALGGHNDWHVPTIGELRSLIRGCPDTMTGGACGVADTCLDLACWNDSCRGCPYGGGPGAGGAYWPPGLGGTVYWYWSSSSCAGASSSAWYVHFNNGYVYNIGKPYTCYVRCVRPGP